MIFDSIIFFPTYAPTDPQPNSGNTHSFALVILKFKFSFFFFKFQFFIFRCLSKINQLTGYLFETSKSLISFIQIIKYISDKIYLNLKM